MDVGGQTIFAYRAVAMLLLPWIIARLIRRSLKPNLLDSMVFAAGIWMIISFSFVYGPGDGIIRGTALAFDLIVPFLVARICLKTLTDLRRLLVVMAPGVAIVTFLMMIESVSHTIFVRPAAAAIFGDLPSFRDGTAVGNINLSGEIRLGLMRAFGPFSHPILGGVFLASLLPLYFNAGLVRWPSWVGRLSGLGAFFTLSSAALLALIIFAILQGYRLIVERVTFLTWRMFVVGSTAFLGALQLVTDNGVIPFLSQFTLTPQTAFYRRLIWDYGSDSVKANPWFGIGYDGYQRMHWMPQSVDAHWLMLAIRHGLIPALLLLGAMIAVVTILSKRSLTLQSSERRMIFGVIATYVVLIIAGFTVSYFGATSIWFALALGIGVSLSANVRPAPKTHPHRGRAPQRMPQRMVMRRR